MNTARPHRCGGKPTISQFGGNDPEYPFPISPGELTRDQVLRSRHVEPELGDGHRGLVRVGGGSRVAAGATGRPGRGAAVPTLAAIAAETQGRRKEIENPGYQKAGRASFGLEVVSTRDCDRASSPNLSTPAIPMIYTAIAIYVHLVVLGRSGGWCGTTRPARLSSWVTTGATSGNSRLSWPSVKRISAVESCSTCWRNKGNGKG